MADVYIDSLTLENFGPFYGEHTLNFGSLDGRCGVLVGGKNGAGKTHLLRALYLAVVGESGVGDLKRVETGSDATRFLFDRSLNRRAQAEGQDSVRLKVRVSLRDDKGGGRRNVDLVREIRHRPNSPPVWRSWAQRLDTPGLIEDEQVIQRIRDSFLPRHLARFFFFDAERSQSINLGQQDIVEGVSRILGLWTYGELENDLRQYVFCNGRMVLRADQSNLTVWAEDERVPKYHPDFARFRGLAYFDSDDASLLPWTTTKTGVDSDSSVYRAARQQMIEITRPVLEFLRKVEDERKKHADGDIQDKPLAGAIAAAEIFPATVSVLPTRTNLAGRMPALQPVQPELLRLREQRVEHQPAPTSVRPGEPDAREAIQRPHELAAHKSVEELLGPIGSPRLLDSSDDFAQKSVPFTIDDRNAV